MNQKFNIETIAVVLAANYSEFTENYNAYEERYIERLPFYTTRLLMASVKRLESY